MRDGFLVKGCISTEVIHIAIIKGLVHKKYLINLF